MFKKVRFPMIANKVLQSLDAFYCMLGISLLQHLHKQAQVAWNGISGSTAGGVAPDSAVRFALPIPGHKDPHRVATVLSKQTLPQQALATTLGLDQLHITQRG